MKLLVLSDLHNEFDAFEPRPSVADVVILAGDIDVGAKGIEWAQQHFSKPVVYVAGNHEFYRGMWQQVPQTLEQAAADCRNVHLLENSSVVIDGVRFIGATLWTDFNLYGSEHRGAAIEVSLEIMADYRAIKVRTAEGLRRLHPADTIEVHNASRIALERLLAEPFQGPTVVVTHHLPHWGSVHARWREAVSSAAFATDLEGLMLRFEPDLWIHGHTHDSADYRVGATRVVCNPRGYVRDGIRENDAFIDDLVVSL
jgi:predicted phosphodiesterase